MSTPSGTDLTHHTRTELETMRRNAHAESLRLYDAAIAITTEQGTLGYTIADGERWAALQAEWRATFAAAEDQRRLAMTICGALYPEVTRADA
jgi:hypothetical protein